MGKTTIQWCDFSVNPIRARLNGRVGHHCVKVSPGCTNCYASTMQRRFGLPPFEVGKRKDVEVFFDIKKCHDMVKRRKPTRYFWCDMSDLFGEWVPDEWVDRCFATMALTPQHTHQVLTKRPERMRDYIRGLGDYGGSGRGFWRLEEAARALGHSLQFQGIPLLPWPLPNVWLGTSCEDQERADERIPLLLQTPAAVRFVSAEPLLGPIDLTRSLGYRSARGVLSDDPRAAAIRNLRESGLSWAIVGGESGAQARPMHVEWARDIVRQCQAARVPCFVKQLGRYPVSSKREMVNGIPVWDHLFHDTQGREPTGEYAVVCADSKGGDISEFPDDLRVREFPA